MKSFKNFVSEAKKYSMKQAMDWFGSDEKDIAWTMSSKKRGEPLFGHWLDMSTGEVVAAKEKNPPKGVKVYKESMEEGKKTNLRDLDHDEFMKYGDTNPRGRADPEWNKERKRRYKNDYQRTRRKQMKNEELAGTSTADVVGTVDDVADWKDPKKKKKTKPLTRHFIEVGGKRRKLTK